jgi:Peptidase S24-like
MAYSKHLSALPLDPPTAFRPRLRAALRELARERPVALTVRGDCMAPRLRDGQRVEVAPARRYWPGDIVAFETPQGRIAVHRLLGCRRLNGRLVYLTRGDRSAMADSPVPPDHLVGRTLTPPAVAERARAVLALLAMALCAIRRRLPG